MTIRLLTVAALLAALAACTETNRYPISGEECSPDDPVQTLDAPECPPVL
jgi:hypothetical protein